MHPDILGKTERAGRLMPLASHALVLLVVVGLAWHLGVSPEQLGLHPRRWRSALAAGCGVGAAWVGLKAALSLTRGAEVRLGSHHLQKGTKLFWVCSFLVGGFVEELWRALCLFALADAGETTLVCIVVTASAFAAGHFRNRLGGMLFSFIFGAVAALVFLWLGSLVATYSAHVLTNLGTLYIIRREHWAR